MLLDGYPGQLLAGLVTTVEVALTSLLIASCIGFGAALLALSKRPSLRWLTQCYSSIIRGVPDLLLMLMLFYGGQILLNKLITMSGLSIKLELNQFVSGVITLGIIYGAYCMETFRGALMNIPVGQTEAAKAFGMSNFKLNTRILMPQMIRLALPGFTNNLLVISKATALVSVIGLQDMMYQAKAAGVATREPFNWLLLAGLGYLILTSVSLLLLKWVEHRYSVGHSKSPHS